MLIPAVVVVPVTWRVLLIVVAPFRVLAPVTLRLPPTPALLVTLRALVVVVPELLMVVLLIVQTPERFPPVSAAAPSVSVVPLTVAPEMVPLALIDVAPEIAPALVIPPPPLFKPFRVAEEPITTRLSIWVCRPLSAEYMADVVAYPLARHNPDGNLK